MGRRDARRLDGAGTGTITRNFLTSLATAGGARAPTPAPSGTARASSRTSSCPWTTARPRPTTTAASSCASRQPATVADIDRGGYQVAILDNGTNAAPATQRSGAITQERVTPTTFAADALADHRLQADARVEHADDQRRPLAHPGLRQRRAREHLRQRHAQRPRRLHRARERRQQPDVPQRARQELAPDTVAPTVTVDSPAAPRSSAPRSRSRSAARTSPSSPPASRRSTASRSPPATPLPTRPPARTRWSSTATDAEGHTTTRTIPYDVVAAATGDGGRRGRRDALPRARRAGDLRGLHARRARRPTRRRPRRPSSRRRATRR